MMFNLPSEYCAAELTQGEKMRTLGVLCRGVVATAPDFKTALHECFHVHEAAGADVSTFDIEQRVAKLWSVEQRLRSAILKEKRAYVMKKIKVRKLMADDKKTRAALRALLMSQK